MTGTRPTAVGYVSGPGSAALDRQRNLVTRHAQDEGLALERIMTDRFDGFTISQLVADVLATEARFVLIPEGVRMADAQARVALDLEAHGAACVVIGKGSADRPREAARLATRLPSPPPAGTRNSLSVSPQTRKRS